MHVATELSVFLCLSLKINAFCLHEFFFYDVPFWGNVRQMDRQTLVMCICVCLEASVSHYQKLKLQHSVT